MVPISAARPSPVRRWVIGVALAWLLISAFLVVRAGLALRAAEHRIDDARAEVSLAAIDKPTPNLRAAANDLGRAHGSLSSPILVPYRFVPVLGRQLRAVTALSGSAHRVLRVGIDALDDGRKIVRNVPSTGPGRVQFVERVSGIAHRSRLALQGADLGPTSRLIGPVARAHTRIQSEFDNIVAILTRAEVGSRGLEKFLRGPSRYLVFGANPAEMRSGSGMFLSAGILEVNNGELHLGPMKPVDDFAKPPADVPLDPDVNALWGRQAPGAAWRFANMSPRFDATGALVQRMWAATGGAPVDGAFAVDPVAVSNLLDAVGPQHIDGQTVSSDNAVKLFVHDQYLTFDTTGFNAERHEFLGDAVAAIFAAIESGNTKPVALGESLGRSVGGRRLLAWSSNTVEQRAWQALDMSGELPPHSMMFSLQNRGANKLDYFQHVDARLATGSSDNRSVVNVEFRISNTATAREPRYIAGPAKGLYSQEPGLYVGIASINVPRDATNVTLTGGDYALVAGPDGNSQVVSAFVQISRGETIRLNLRFALPAGQHSLMVLPSARMPNVSWHAGRATWLDSGARVVNWESSP